MRTRIVLFLLAAFWLTVAYGIYEARETEVIWPSFWPWYFVACAVVTGAFAAVSCSKTALCRVLFFTSGLMVPVGFMGRVWVTFARAGTDGPDGQPLIDIGRAISALGLYGALGLLTAVAWVKVFGPIARVGDR